MATYTRKEEIKYLDVDKNNRLTNKAIINILQNVAGAHAENIGDGLNSKHITHTAWLILNWKIQVFDRPKYQDVLNINTWVNKVEKCYLWREFEVYCNKKLVTKASSKWVLINVDSKRITKVLPEVIEKYNANGKSIFDEKMEEKLKEPEYLELTYKDTIERSKIDTNNHLNNLYYLDYAMESLPEDIYQEANFNNIEIMYKIAVKYKDKIKCFYAKEEDKHVIVIKSENLEHIHSIIKMW